MCVCVCSVLRTIHVQLVVSSVINFCVDACKAKGMNENSKERYTYEREKRGRMRNKYWKEEEKRGDDKFVYVCACVHVCVCTCVFNTTYLTCSICSFVSLWMHVKGNE